MKRIATMMALALLVGAMNIAWAQPVRNGDDIILLRDIGEAEITLDGMLDEAVWEQAETISLVWDGDHPRPGGGQFIEGNPVLAEPSDPIDATLRFLREGNLLWIGVEAEDASIGGSSNLWSLDGIIMSMVNRANRPDFPTLEDVNFFGGSSLGNVRSEFILGWWNRDDTTDTGDPLPGVAPVGFSSSFGPCGGCGVDSTWDTSLWNYAATVNGTSNDDSDTDEGYVMELFINMEAMGYDFDQPGGDRAPFTISVDDYDYNWPFDEQNSFLSRVYWQFAYANNYNTGVGYVTGSPGLTVDSGPLDVTGPEFNIPAASGEITLDGALDEAAWDAVDYTFFLQYKPELEVADMNPGSLLPYYQFYFRPDINGDGNTAEVVDKTIGQFKMIHDGSMLYVGLDTDDQAISGVQSENGRDGFRLSIRNLDSLRTSGIGGGALDWYSLEFQIDSTGALTYAGNATDYRNIDPDAITGAVMLKGAGTAGDASDIDEGYQMEVAIDLTAFGYDEDLSDERRTWTHLAFFDGDYLPSPGDSYATRTWHIGERGEGASLYGYLSDETTVANEDPTEVPDGFALKGNYPNPFNPSTTLNYTLSRAGNVTLFVYDVLGRRVAEQAIGAQAAGEQRVAFDGKNLSSGVYFYRLQVQGADKSAFLSPVGRMVLLK